MPFDLERMRYQCRTIQEMIARLAWQAMYGVQMPALGKGLAGLMVDPTNQNVGNVIFWLPQVVLPTPQPSLVETAPFAAVIPSANALGSNAVVSIRLWDNEGNASTPFLQYQIPGASTWQNATLTTLDGAAYNLATRVGALPTGNNHTLGWNALADVGQTWSRTFCSAPARRISCSPAVGR
jgi:hypothetical protein